MHLHTQNYEIVTIHVKFILVTEFRLIGVLGSDNPTVTLEVWLNLL